MHATKRAPAFAAMAAGVVCIAWSALFVRWTAMGGIASAFYRCLIASAALWTLLLIRRTPLRIPSGHLKLVALGGLFFAGDVGLFNIAVLHTGAGSATFLANNSPLIVGLVTWALTRRLPSARFWSALALSLAGAGLVVSGDAHLLHSALSADLLAVLASISFALYLVTTERLRNALDSLTLLALSSSASALSLLAAALLGHLSLTVPGPRSWLALLGLGLICQIGGYLSLTYALGHLPVTVSSIALLGVAPLTAVFALVLFHEPMHLPEILGGALILLAVWIVSRESRPVPAEL